MRDKLQRESNQKLLLKDEIFKHAQIFRDALENCKSKLTHISFENFPRGSCGDTSVLLGTYLSEKGLGDFNYISGGKKIGKWSSHAWLEQNGLIIDITADQFEDQDLKVIVVRNSNWHNNNFVYE